MRCATWLFLSLIVALNCTCFKASAEPTPLASDYWQALRGPYDSGKYDEALHVLLGVQPPPSDASYYYNLGTVYFRLGQAGRAVAHLEKARRITADAGGINADIQHNLDIAKGSLGKTIGVERLDPGAGLFDIVVERAQSVEVRTLAGAIVLLCLLLALRGALATGSRGASSSIIPFALGLTGFLLISVTQYSPGLLGVHECAVALDRHSIRSGPGGHFPQLNLIEAGTRLRLLGASISNPQNPSETWHQVRYSSDGIGWVQAADLIFL